MESKIIIQDPVPGNGNDWFAFTTLNILGAEKAARIFGNPRK